jgi:hypothetical protein
LNVAFPHTLWLIVIFVPIPLLSYPSTAKPLSARY